MTEALQGRDQNAFRLSTNYRNSREIFELAADYARAAIPGADLPRAVRETGVEPARHRGRAGGRSRRRSATRPRTWPTSSRAPWPSSSPPGGRTRWPAGSAPATRPGSPSSGARHQGPRVRRHRRRRARPDRVRGAVGHRGPCTSCSPAPRSGCTSSARRAGWQSPEPDVAADDRRAAGGGPGPAGLGPDPVAGRRRRHASRRQPRRPRAAVRRTPRSRTAPARPALRPAGLRAVRPDPRARLRGASRRRRRCQHRDRRRDRRSRPSDIDALAPGRAVAYDRSASRVRRRRRRRTPSSSRPSSATRSATARAPTW